VGITAFKLADFPRGGRPRTSRGTAREDKQTGEVNRVPSRSQTSADPVNVGESATSGALIRPASEPVMDSKREPTSDASVEYTRRRPGSGRRGPMDRWSADPFFYYGDRGPQGQPVDEAVMSAGRSPHGVESDPKTGQGKLSEPGNPAVASVRMTEATGDRGGRGRSLRSSPRTGKPSTWRRQAVGAVSKQEVDRCLVR
jgi:hypothetical protein